MLKLECLSEFFIIVRKKRMNKNYFAVDKKYIKLNEQKRVLFVTKT